MNRLAPEIAVTATQQLANRVRMTFSPEYRPREQLADRAAPLRRTAGVFWVAHAYSKIKSLGEGCAPRPCGLGPVLARSAGALGDPHGRLLRCTSRPRPSAGRVMSPRTAASPSKTRSGGACNSPAVRGKRRCRMHGVAAGSGAPRDNKNALKLGHYSREAIAKWKAVRDLCTYSRKLMMRLFQRK